MALCRITCKKGFDEDLQGQSTKETAEAGATTPGSHSGAKEQQEHPGLNNQPDRACAPNFDES